MRLSCARCAKSSATPAASTTIAGHLRAIEIDRTDGPGLALPDALVRGLVDGAAELWRGIAAAADARHELGTSRATAASLEHHVGESFARAERLKAQLAEARATVRAAETDAASRCEERDRLEHELELVRAQTSAERATFDARLAGQAARMDELQRRSSAPSGRCVPTRGAH